MKDYIYQNTLINKKQLKELLAWSFSKYDSMQASLLADELKYLGFKYATQAGISISIEDLKVPATKNEMLEKANKDILNAEKICLKGKITDVERFQKIIDTWSIASESLKDNVVSYFKTYDPLNSVYIMAFSGARGNLSQVRQLVGMRGLMADPSGEIMRVPIKKNFREGLTITDYLMSGYGARKGIVDTALKTANSGYLTRRLIDIAQDIVIREKDCLTSSSFLIDSQTKFDTEQLIGRVLLKSVYDSKTEKLIAKANTQLTLDLLNLFNQKQISKFYIRSPLTCNLYHSICQMCYGWDLSNQNLVDLGEAVGILAGQSIGEPGTQLTMRTFHTGGIFTSEARQQIISPKNGIIKFSKILKTIILRTNRGEDVLLTKNSGSLILIPEKHTDEIIQIELLRNTMLFVKSNQYIKQSAIIGELISTDKQTLTERKPILSDTAGEIFIPRLKTRMNLITQNRLLWILSGQVYQAPSNSFLNFYTDHKINKNSYIFRTKLINQYSGYTKVLNQNKNLLEQKIQITNETYFLENSYVQKILKPITNKNYLLNFNNLTYLITLKDSNSKNWKRCKKYKPFATSFNNNFKTLTGGIMYYDQRIKQKFDSFNTLISYNIAYEISKEDYDKVSKDHYENYLKKLENKIDKNGFIFYQNFLNYQEMESIFLKFKLKKKIVHNSLIWLSEETYKLNCDKNILLVENGNFIAKNFEIIPNIISKTAGIITVSQKNNMIEEIAIKAGFVYQGKQFEQLDKKVYYPGEIIFDNIKITQPSLCEHINNKSNNQLLIRPFAIYEIPKEKTVKSLFSDKNNSKSIFTITNKITYLYKTNQKIKTSNHINLISQNINLKAKNSVQNNTIIDLSNSFKTKRLNLRISENLLLKHYIPAHLKYTNLQYCLLVEPTQFIDSYTTLGYLESLITNSLEIVKFKSKRANKKQVFLISNKDCITVRKEQGKNKTANELIIDNINVNQTGKVLIDNGQFLTVQKGRPYFFPNCKSDDSKEKLDLQYKLIGLNNTISNNTNTFLNYYDVTKRSLVERLGPNKKSYGFKVKFSKMFIKKNGKFYSSPIPLFLNNFSIIKEEQKRLNEGKNEINNFIIKNTQLKIKQCLPLLLKSSELVTNKIKRKTPFNNNLTGLKFLKYPFNKSIGIHSLTEDYFEQEVNNVYCKNGEFIEKGEVIGLLNFEKEITGDIVQGLPRIEELLEARKKKPTNKHLATNQKKSLLIQKTSIDSSFEFQKLGTTIKENDKINPHNLLKIYFNYYGIKKQFFSNKEMFALSYRLTDNYEASYRTFKKIQLLILNAVQSVYESQGVSIANKHLEVIIKQMTTKVLITHEGHTPLLPREVVDLYHIQYINKIIEAHNKRPAYYVPLLLGITKAALNNPSFISAASFQETTRVLTKAAIEGRVDWLRGLKENIIIGHLIPSGTGYQSYSNCFNQLAQSKTKINLEKIKIKI
ncbi:plastid RNA polymerase beta subunit, plastid-encoded [Thalassiosira pseudonana CCMP1335]|jgi:DNA-directed RNA polymerase subunit beta'|uniref:DNA-directed RNA polymerase subunit beta'' n=2 Tax=Thalassiosira pseudonana TaxID=35128 RepID=RPOC2_THAPS|nr:RNA polymerase beta'' subunit [Thalassiosira pseudonana]XP_002297515.1 plastid RNA polymerase beta subunit, plastid-encoded [Thalassiosira pseudonana CCMP1335]A0T0Q9.1 RecName: Full=DNA-directed RNA polymerase subunit beta''; AltName: Full=PEP; AltName: Full=Plastid-encoded RNA polymerase subunit beta''; Short=RNA polymerase subunit beta'' [Thalassiosira pseudonana]ABK20744.1 DNA-directed RNA polymerase beta' chain [Thalassiosira pseudonana]EED86155.1 plastid RNA polymerase beta subunit, pla